MMYYIASDSVDPCWNLALEQYVFDALDPGHSYFMLWQNHNAIIVGKYQNTLGEINAAYVKERDITVVRRLSGGGAVYHDLGNLNFTFIVDDNGGLDFAAFCRPLIAALTSLGATAEISGRNDMTLNGKKFSGNAQYRKSGRIMHHGTLLYDSDLTVLSGALNVTQDKIESKGIKSVRSRVTNIRPYVKDDLPLPAFWDAISDYMVKENDMRPYTLTQADIAAVDKLRSDVYSQWSWNYGASPAFTLHKERRVEGCGKLEIYLDVVQGIIHNAAFRGDFFSTVDPDGLAELLKGQPLFEPDLIQALSGVDISLYFNNLTLDNFISILLQ